MDTQQTIDLGQLTPEQMAHLQEQFEARKKDEEKKREADREALAEMEDELVQLIVGVAIGLANNIGDFKLDAIKKFEPLMKMKIEMLKASEKQRSFTFKSKDKKQKIIINYNETWKCDDGIHACIDLAKQWMSQVAEKSEDAAAIVSIVEKLIASRDGSYSTDGIWDLINAAEGIDNDLLKEAAEAGRHSLYKEKTSVAVNVWINGKTGWEQLPLSATKA